MNAELILAIIQAILTYGPNAVTVIAEAMESKDVTADDIRALTIEKSPDEYFD